MRSAMQERFTVYTRVMAQADRDRIAQGLRNARTKREQGQALEAEAKDEIAALAIEGLAERMTQVEMADYAGVNRLTITSLLKRKR